MRVSVELSKSFEGDALFRFEELLSQFLIREKLMESPQELRSERFLNRSVIPHVKRFSKTFNRIEAEESDTAFDRYWSKTGNPRNSRLAYFVYFMPCNALRLASIWEELGRWGYRWQAPQFSCIEIGAGPAAGSCGVLLGERVSPLSLPSQENWGAWALIERDKASLSLGSKWLETFSEAIGTPLPSVRGFQRKLDFTRPLLPRGAPRFSLWISSFVTNEQQVSPEELASSMLDTWEHHLEEDGLVILVEPALKAESRKLLQLRAALIEQSQKTGRTWLKVLLPCLGHQSCGALAEAEDWCHEEVTWWRPGYLREIDRLAGLDRRTLPFSYLVLTRSTRTREELLPLAFNQVKNGSLVRAVSPARVLGKETEFYSCGAEGKRRLRMPATPDLERGDLVDIAWGDKNPDSEFYKAKRRQVISPSPGS